MLYIISEYNVKIPTNKVWRKHKGQPTVTQATLGTRHRTTTNKTNIQHRKLKMRNTDFTKKNQPRLNPCELQNQDK